MATITNGGSIMCEETFNYCQQCDKIIEGDYTFCPECGELLIDYTQAQLDKYGIDNDLSELVEL